MVARVLVVCVTVAVVSGAGVQGARAEAQEESGTIERVSLNSQDQQVSDFEYWATGSVSGSGQRVVFDSRSREFLADDSNLSDVFLRNRRTGTTGRISLNSAEDQLNGESYAPVISGNGRYVAFVSHARNVVKPYGPPKPWQAWIYVRDLRKGVTHLASVFRGRGVATQGAPALSYDGRRLVFVAFSHSNQGVYVRNLVRKTTRLLSGLKGRDFLDGFRHPALSSNGRFASFVASRVRNPPDGEHESTPRRTYSYDLRSSVRRVTLHGGDFPGFITDDGRYMAYQRKHTACDVLDGFCRPIVLLNLANRQYEPVSVSTDGRVLGGSLSELNVISADGRFVVFWTRGRLGPDDTNNHPDVYRRDTFLNTTVLISQGSAGPSAYGAQSNPSTSRDGQYVTFNSWSSNLVPDDTNGTPDLFLWSSL